MTRRVLAWTGGTLLALIVLVVLTALILINTASGTRWLVSIAERVADGALQVSAIEGTLAGPLHLEDLTYNDPKSGLAVAVDSIDLDIAMRALLSMRVHVLSAQVSSVDVRLGRPAEEPPQDPEQPFTLEAPIDIVVDQFQLRDLLVRNETAEAVRLNSMDLAGSWVGTNVTVKTLDVKSPQGEIVFAGEVQEAETYVGDGEGRFRWTQGAQTYAGTIEVIAHDAKADMELALTQPLRAHLTLSLEQERELPWNFRLSVPSFDPRDSLLPDSALTSLAADLAGRGTLSQGVTDGKLVINGEAITFDRLAFTRDAGALGLEARILAGGGTLNADAAIQTAATPAQAKVDAKWDRITLPEQWAGQVLRTHGEMLFEGSSESYRARGDLSVGPPERMSDLELSIEGTPSLVRLDQFDVVQADGRLAATGRVQLQPQIEWLLNANAQSFDPGEFATAWPGDLNFTLDTEGALADAGPRATLKLDQLRGKLRGRALSGTADLALTPNKVISGEADLRSGQSQVRVQAEPGEVLDLVADIDIPALDDWVPNAAGIVKGRFTGRGNWPETTVQGQVNASSVAFNDMRAQSASLQLNIASPTKPNGTIDLRVTEAAAGGMEVRALRAQADGSAASHSLQLDMEGSPIGTQVVLQGSQVEAGWRGTLSTLVLDIEEAARLALQSPVEINYTPEESSISEACFADGAIRLCLEGAMQADGRIDARYSLAEVPFALANAFAAAQSPLSFAGTLAGEGHIARNAKGEFSGNAQLRSARGEIARLVADEEQPEVLLSFDDLAIDAALEADRARTQLAARLNETGSLRGELAITKLGQPAAELNGSLAAHLPSIAVVELFAPQVANVKGEFNLRAAVQGRMDDPQITGELRLNDLAADIPEYGLNLKNGLVTITPRPDNTFELEGGIQSGEGSVALAGMVRTEGTSAITIIGKQFLAADMPGARVIMEPDLLVERTTERITLGGKLTIPEATVNLQELPRGQGGGAQISSDVVIVDAKTQEEAQAEAAPIYANITVVLGEEVELAGFGLLAQVGGQLALRERPGEPTTGSGEVEVTGRYKAYGQDLTIQEGRLLFANSPLDNPNLNLTATREVDEVVVGLKATGTAKNPVLTVFSDPAMGQTEALAYLVTGKPLDQVGQSEGEGDALQSAARSLGTAAGGLLAKNVGKRLGIDEFGIKEDEMIGGAAFTVGQYLSPRLYLSYGVGLFEPGEVITLRYKLTDDLAVQAQSGTTESRAGVEYRLER
jgi:translocation and assembly module TamB